MQNYTVVALPNVFRCDAENTAHAVEQFVNAYPDEEITKIEVELTPDRPYVKTTPFIVPVLFEVWAVEDDEARTIVNDAIYDAVTHEDADTALYAYRILDEGNHEGHLDELAAVYASEIREQKAEFDAEADAEDAANPA